MIRVSIVIVSYNTVDILDQCLESIERCESDYQLDVIVVDNGSHDGSPDLVAERYPGVRLIRNSDNLGFSKASNQGIRISDADYILLLNSDTVVLPGSIDRVVEYLAANPTAGVVGCKVLKPDGSLDQPCRRSFPTPANSLYQRLGLTRLFPRSRRFGAYYVSYLDPDVLAEVDCVMGAYMMIRRAVVDDIGLLDEECFFYAEDIDYCYRAKQAGWRVVYFPAATIIHHRGASTAKNRLRATTYFHQSMLIFYRKHQAPHRTALVNGIVYSGIALSYATAIVWNKITRPRLARPLTNLREFVGSARPLGQLAPDLLAPDLLAPDLPAAQKPAAPDLPEGPVPKETGSRMAEPDDADRTLVG